jgi:galactonate dehydratase
VAWCGGLTSARKIASHAEVHGISIALHNPLGPLASAASWQLAATLPNFLIGESHIAASQRDLWDRYVEDAPEIRDGAWIVGDRPGLGCRLRIDEILKHPPNLDYDRHATR